MSATFDIWVPDSGATERVRQALRSVSGVPLRSSLSARGTWTFLVVYLDRLGAGNERWSLDAATHPVCPVFIGKFGAGKTRSLILQHVATLSAWAGRKRVEPFVAPDGATLRRLVLARKAGAEKRLIATASIEGRSLCVWSCEPRPYVVDTSEISVLSSMKDAALRSFTLSNSGSRLHWDEGDVDLNMDTILEYADSTVRREHQSERRAELTAYAAAIKSLRRERGLSQSAIAGLSERQVRRLEQGASLPHIGSLEKLARAHSMTVNEYLADLAKRTVAASRTPRKRRVPRRPRAPR